MSFIWLPKEKYFNYQTSRVSKFSEKENKVVVVSFLKKINFDKEISKIEMDFAGDTTCVLYCNGELVCGTDAKASEDFMTIETPTNNLYYQTKTIEFNKPTKEVVIFAKVQLGCYMYWDFSSGFGGFHFSSKVYDKDGGVHSVESDDSWLCKLEKTYGLYSYDNSVEEEDWCNAEISTHKWNLVKANIKIPQEKEIVYPNVFTIEPNKKKTFTVDFPVVYAAYYSIEVECEGLLIGKINTFETKETIVSIHNFNVVESDVFRFFDMVSCGGYKLVLNNKSEKPATVKIKVLHSTYPYDNSYDIKTNNDRLNDLFNKCKYAVNNCSQTIYLDSPKHCEPLASCSGDYNVESLVNAMSSGDLSLSKHHLRGYAAYLAKENSFNSNLNYALVFIKWLKNIYMLSGDKELIKDCLQGVKSTIDMWKTFLGDNYLIEKSYNYIFIDWLVVDEVNLFSPSKNLGQSVTTMFYYDALVSASLLYSELGDEKGAKSLQKLAKKVKNAINTLLFNREKGLYCEGLNTPDEEIPYIRYKLPNTDKIYYRKHANILAVNFGLTPKKTAKQILHKIFYGEIKDCLVQPFFLHYLFESIHNADMDKKYAMKLLKLFTKHIKVKDKGLPEGFYKPDPSYTFDRSHAWAATPFYSFIIAASGLKILKPGMSEINLEPKYLGVDAEFVIPTPQGNIEINITKKNTQVKVPEGIKVIK